MASIYVSWKRIWKSSSISETRKEPSNDHGVLNNNLVSFD